MRWAPSMAKACAAAAASALLGFAGAPPAKAAVEALYSLSGDVAPYVVPSGTTTTTAYTAGFAFQIKPYYTATIKSIAIWVNQAALSPTSPYRTTILLVNVNNESQPIISSALLKDECPTLTSQGFCSRDLTSTPQTLTSGITYRLTASYSTSAIVQLKNDNLYFISDLPSNQVSYSSAINIGSPYYDGTCTGSLCSANGLFGPNLNVDIAYTPPPASPTPGPLPLMGAASFFLHSRRLRRRIEAY